MGVDEAGPEPGLLELRLDVALAVGVGVPALGPGVQLDVGEHALLQAAAAPQQVGGGGRGDPVDAAAQQRLERDVADGLDQERVEEQLAELAVARPRLAGPEPFERPDVDEHRLGAGELDVVRRGVLGDQPLGEGAAGERQLQPGGVAEHLERPLVWIGEDVDALVTQHGGPVAGHAGAVSSTSSVPMMSPRSRASLKNVDAARAS